MSFVLIFLGRDIGRKREASLFSLLHGWWRCKREGLILSNCGGDQRATDYLVTHLSSLRSVLLFLHFNLFSSMWLFEDSFKAFLGLLYNEIFFWMRLYEINLFAMARNCLFSAFLCLLLKKSWSLSFWCWFLVFVRLSVLIICKAVKKKRHVYGFLGFRKYDFIKISLWKIRCGCHLPITRFSFMG
jgi:hypothetical protein